MYISACRYKLNFENFALQGNSNCSYDYLELFDAASTADKADLFARVCGRGAPDVGEFPSQRFATLKFFSDSAVESKGFKILAIRTTRRKSCFNTSNAEATFVHSTRTQRFLKNI